MVISIRVMMVIDLIIPHAACFTLPPKLKPLMVPLSDLSGGDRRGAGPGPERGAGAGGGARRVHLPVCGVLTCMGESADGDRLISRLTACSTMRTRQGAAGAEGLRHGASRDQGRPQHAHPYVSAATIPSPPIPSPDGHPEPINRPPGTNQQACKPCGSWRSTRPSPRGGRACWRSCGRCWTRPPRRPARRCSSSPGSCTSRWGSSVSGLLPYCPHTPVPLPSTHGLHTHTHIPNTVCENRHRAGGADEGGAQGVPPRGDPGAARFVRHGLLEDRPARPRKFGWLVLLIVDVGRV